MPEAPLSYWTAELVFERTVKKESGYGDLFL